MENNGEPRGISLGQEVIHSGVEIIVGARDFKAHTRRTLGRASGLRGGARKLLSGTAGPGGRKREREMKAGQARLLLDGAHKRERAREGDKSRAGNYGLVMVNASRVTQLPKGALESWEASSTSWEMQVARWTPGEGGARFNGAGDFLGAWGDGSDGEKREEELGDALVHDTSQLLGGARRRERAREGDEGWAGETSGLLGSASQILDGARKRERAQEGEEIRVDNYRLAMVDTSGATQLPGGDSRARFCGAGGFLGVLGDHDDLDPLGEACGGLGTLGNSRKHMGKSNGTFGAWVVQGSG
ncbi:unnamed protein product [Ilex paraguariensis]|uniref:Uncharacterized protein n=1 Tax=Ilex paraguariensis TaxID=185542 RepID=A0ABC8SDP2_9AQUA